jgi:N-acyl-D-aspartate/D-glutamate deacylase
MDLLLRDALLIDGTASPARVADVAVDGDRIIAIEDPGRLTPDSHTKVVDLDGLVLAPGFIDVHTHYDAQILWDGDLTPSSWHGVTSVVMGNCGFGVAPTRSEHRDIIVRTFENVEGMSMEALNEGIDWCFETFPEYLAALDQRRKRLNVAAFVGHSTLRLFVLGGEERLATEGELATMQGLLREAMLQGAVGFSTSRQPNHQGAFGRPVPSRFADVEEVYALTSVLGELGKGVVEVSIGPGLFVDQFSEMAVKYGVPVTWTALVARSWSARRGLPPDRLPTDRHADEPRRADAPGRGRRMEGGSGPCARPSGGPVPGSLLAGPGPADDPRRLEPPMVEDRYRGDR